MTEIYTKEVAFSTIDLIVETKWNLYILLFLNSRKRILRTKWIREILN